jgi:hypothetical protein
MGLRGAAVAAAAVWLVSCASPATEPTAAARIRLESYRGLPSPQQRATALPRRVDVLVDLTESMGRPCKEGGTRAFVAYSRASDLLLSLPQGTEITLRAQGHQVGEACALPERLAGPAVPTLRMAFVRQLEGLGPRSEGSLPAALERIRLDLERERALLRTRVVLLTDFDSQCGGDLCAEARALVEAGGALEVAALGGTPVPPCLSELLADRSGGGRQSPRFVPPPPRFVIYAVQARAKRPDPVPVAQGRAGEGAVEVPAGLIEMVVELDPPETVGPFRVEPGGSALVRLLDYPQTDPPARIWRVEREGEPVGRAFPPPEALSVIPE